MKLSPQLASNELNDIARMLDLCKEKARLLKRAKATDADNRDSYADALIEALNRAEAYRIGIRTYTANLP